MRRTNLREWMYFPLTGEHVCPGCTARMHAEDEAPNCPVCETQQEDEGVCECCRNTAATYFDTHGKDCWVDWDDTVYDEKIMEHLEAVQKHNASEYVNTMRQHATNKIAGVLAHLESTRHNDVEIAAELRDYFKCQRAIEVACAADQE